MNDDQLSNVERHQDIPDRSSNVKSNNMNYVPLYLATMVFILIIASYAYLIVSGISFNIYRAAGTIGISGIVALYCAYLRK